MEKELTKKEELREDGVCKFKEEWKAVFYNVKTIERISKMYHEKNSWYLMMGLVIFHPCQSTFCGSRG